MDRLNELVTKEIQYVNIRKNRSAHPSVTAMSVANILREVTSNINEEGGDIEKKEPDADNGLTPEENEEKKELIKSGFLSWSREEFKLFINACEKYGRKDIKAISEVRGGVAIEFLVILVRRGMEWFWKNIFTKI